MAEVNSVTIKIDNVPNDDDKKQVTVGWNLVFSESEAGKQFKVAVNLFGEDLPGDLGGTQNPLTQALFPKSLYTFRFGDLKRPYMTVTAAAGQKSFSDVQQVNTSVLNEDPTYMDVGIPGYPESWPYGDEVYAVVSVASEARSLETVSLLA